MVEWAQIVGSKGPLLTADGLCKAFARVPVLWPVSLRLEAGGSVAVFGPNGSGKTTLLRLLAGVSRPTSGTASICGHQLADERRAAQSHVGFLGHDSYLYDDLTGEEHLQFFGRLRGLRFDRFELLGTLDIVGLGRAGRARVKSYSSGMRRRLGLAWLLLAQPEVLLLDEPHVSLDRDGQELVDELIRGACRSGHALVVASHDTDRVAQLCERVVVLDRGRVVYEGLSLDWRRSGPLWTLGAAPG